MRTFIDQMRILAILLALLIVATVACSDGNNDAATPSVAPSPARATATATVATTTTGGPVTPPRPAATPTASGILAPPRTASAEVVCNLTAPDAEGPFYVPNAPRRSSVGRGHMLRGVVRSGSGCAPLAGAQIEFWLAGPNAEYDDAHRATLLADASGGYTFESNPPPPYAGRPSHIHLRVTAAGHRPLITQFYPTAGQTEAVFDVVLAAER